MESSPPETSDVRVTFQKLSNDAANRNYCRSSPTDGLSASDVDLEHNHSSSPKHARRDPVKGHAHQERKKDDFEKDLRRDSNQSHHGKSDESFRYSEHKFSKSSNVHSRHDELRRWESVHSKSRDYMRNRDKYSQDRYESDSYRYKGREKEIAYLDHCKHREKETYRSDSGRKRSYFEESEGDRNNRTKDDRGEKRRYHKSSEERQDGWGKEKFKGSYNESTDGRNKDGQKLFKEGRGFEDSDTTKDGDWFDRGFRKPLDDKSVLEGDPSSMTKKPCLFSSDGGPGLGEDVAGEKQKPQDVHGTANSAQASFNVSGVSNDLNAAKLAAMRAAELVNMNLAGGMGFMSTEQKKKLLWGNKKSTTTEESSRQWDVSAIADPERQEKFNKLMSLRLYGCLWTIVGCEGRCEGLGTKAQGRKWEQPNPSREAEGTTVKSGEAVYCWAPKKGWQNRWSGPLGITLIYLTHESMHSPVGFMSPFGFHLLDFHKRDTFVWKISNASVVDSTDKCMSSFVP